MKTKTLVLIVIFSLSFISCATKKNTETDTLYHTTWELEYISGIRITFDGLFPNKKPQISFEKTTNRVTGSDSCNGYSTTYTLENNTIFLGEPGPSTMMYCGDGDQEFLKMMKKINKYIIDQDGKLNLMIDDILMMRFSKI